MEHFGDFGNGYSIVGNNGQAVYIHNGRQVSAGDFLKGTGRNGANWNMWNDVWNNGVSTNGVGSDTVQAFNKLSPLNEAANTVKYGYLWGM